MHSGEEQSLQLSVCVENVEDTNTPRKFNPRPCPSCGVIIYGMPGGYDAHCSECGFKDPCCSD